MNVCGRGRAEGLEGGKEGEREWGGEGERVGGGRDGEREGWGGGDCEYLCVPVHLCMHTNVCVFIAVRMLLSVYV